MNFSYFGSLPHDYYWHSFHPFSSFLRLSLTLLIPPPAGAHMARAPSMLLFWVSSSRLLLTHFSSIFLLPTAFPYTSDPPASWRAEDPRAKHALARIGHMPL